MQLWRFNGAASRYTIISHWYIMPISCVNQIDLHRTIYVRVQYHTVLHIYGLQQDLSHQPQ